MAGHATSPGCPSPVTEFDTLIANTARELLDFEKYLKWIWCLKEYTLVMRDETIASELNDDVDTIHSFYETLEEYDFVYRALTESEKDRSRDCTVIQSMIQKAFHLTRCFQRVSARGFTAMPSWEHFSSLIAAMHEQFSKDTVKRMLARASMRDVRQGLPSNVTSKAKWIPSAHADGTQTWVLSRDQGSPRSRAAARSEKRASTGPKRGKSLAQPSIENLVEPCEARHLPSNPPARTASASTTSTPSSKRPFGSTKSPSYYETITRERHDHWKRDRLPLQEDPTWLQKPPSSLREEPSCAPRYPEIPKAGQSGTIRGHAGQIGLSSSQPRRALENARNNNPDRGSRALDRPSGDRSARNNLNNAPPNSTWPNYPTPLSTNPRRTSTEPFQQRRDLTNSQHGPKPISASAQISRSQAAPADTRPGKRAPSSPGSTPPSQKRERYS